MSSAPHFISNKPLLMSRLSEILLQLLSIKTIGETGSKYPKLLSQVQTEKFQGLQLHISHQMRPWSYVKVMWRLRQGPLRFFCKYLTSKQFGESGPKYSQLMCCEIWKIIQSLQFHISHQMKPYSSAQIIWGLSYIYLMGIWA